jgi:beta-xylosidase
MTRFSKGLLASLIFMQIGLLAWAQAPMGLGEQGWYADPEAHVFAGQYWIYPTYSDPAPLPPGTSQFTALQQARRSEKGLRKAYLQQTFMDAFSSPDLVHWTKHPHVLDVKNVPWAAYAVWAPTAIELKGKYYLFFGANDIQKDETTAGGIGVAVSDSPGGPFVDAIGKPLIGAFYNGAQPIDPFVYQDDDGRIYLYYGGQGHCNVVGLTADLKAVTPLPDGELYKEITPAQYVEGPFVVKRNGVYYFMWSEGDWGDASYGVAYARSSSPTGPFTRVGKILETDARVANGPGHHSVLHIPGTDEWYIVYHRHPLGNTEPNQRLMAIDRMYFDKDGNIVPIKMTAKGVAARRLGGASQAR